MLLRRRTTAGVRVVADRAPSDTTPRVQLLTLTQQLPLRTTFVRSTALQRPGAPPARGPTPMASAVARLERITVSNTIRVEDPAPIVAGPSPTTASPPGAAGPTGARGPEGAPGRTFSPRTTMVVRSTPPRLVETAREEDSAAVAVSALPAWPEARSPVPSPPTPPSIDELTTQVIRRIERRATAQRERLARPPGF